MIEQQKRRPGKFRFIPAVLIIAAVLAVAATVGVSALFTNLQPTTDAADIPSGKTERATFAIEGMSCTSCSKGIKAMLKRTPGVISAEVSFERKEAVVEFNPSETSREKIVEAINDMGYKASVKS